MVSQFSFPFNAVPSANRKLSGLDGGISPVKSASVELFKVLSPLGRKTRFPYRWLLQAFLLNASEPVGRNGGDFRFSVVRCETAKNPVLILPVLLA